MSHRVTATTGDTHARITALLCENSAWKAYLDVAGAPEFSGVDVVRLPCSGKAETGLVLRMLEAGSRGVLVVGCPKENCEYVRGSDRAEPGGRYARGHMVRVSTASTNPIHTQADSRPAVSSATWSR